MILNQIYNVDCVEGMKQLDDNSIDMVITSPHMMIWAILLMVNGRIQNMEIQIADMLGILCEGYQLTK